MLVGKGEGKLSKQRWKHEMWGHFPHELELRVVIANGREGNIGGPAMQKKEGKGLRCIFQKEGKERKGRTVDFRV